MRTSPDEASNIVHWREYVTNIFRNTRTSSHHFNVHDLYIKYLNTPVPNAYILYARRCVVLHTNLPHWLACEHTVGCDILLWLRVSESMHVPCVFWILFSTSSWILKVTPFSQTLCPVPWCKRLCKMAYKLHISGSNNLLLYWTQFNFQRSNTCR